jgi:hypothetical protein
VDALGNGHVAQMDKPLLLLNELVAEGVIGQYAIGGAIGATFYIEAFNTEDLDVFVVMQPSPSGLLTLTPIYDAAKAKGAMVRDEHLVVGNWPIQILPPPNALVEEALPHAKDVTFMNVPTRVLTAEYLCAIALLTGRPKDYFRVSAFIEQGAVNFDLLNDLVTRHNLVANTAKVPNWPKP